MKPASILLLAAVGLSSAMPTQPCTKDTAVHKARDTRSLFGHAIQALGARNLVPLNANTAAPPPAADPAVAPEEIPTPTDNKKADEAAAAATGAATDVAATTAVAVATEAATTTAAAAATEAVTTTEAATTEAATTEAATTTAPPALETGAIAIGNGTAGDGGKGKGKGKGNGNGNGKGKGNGNNSGKDKNKGNNGSNSNNNNNNGLGSFISGALAQLGLNGVLDASAIDKLSAGDQISLLAQIVSLQTMKALQMVGGNDIVVVLNQGLKNSGLNVVINA